MKAHVIRFFIGAFGSFLILMMRDVPPLPGLVRLSYLWIRIIFVITGGITTILWQIGDKNEFRSLYFGLTWPAFISLLTLPPN